MFSKKLKELRNEKGLTQEELGKIIFVSRSAIAKWEQGKGMPCKESLALLSNYFQIPENELLKDDDPIIIIDNIEKSSYKVKLALVVTFTYLLAILLLILFIFVSRTNLNIHDGKFLKESYLNDLGLFSLDMIEGDDYFTIGDGDFYSTIDKHETFEKYANYVYNYLKSSPKTAYLSHIHRNIQLDFKKYFLIESKNLKDHITGAINLNEYEEIVNRYEFYYITDYNAMKDDFQLNYLVIESYAIDTIFKPNTNISDRNYNFVFRLHSIDIENYDNYLFASKDFDLEEISLNNENINEYLHITFKGAYNEDVFAIQNLSDYSKCFVEIKFTINLYKNSDNDELVLIDTKELNAFIIDDFYTLHIDGDLFGLNAESDSESYEITYDWEILEESKIYLLEIK